MLDIMHQVFPAADLRPQKVLLTPKRQRPLWEALEAPHQQPHISSPSHRLFSGLCSDRGGWEGETSALQPRQTRIHEQQPAGCVLSPISCDRTPIPSLGFNTKNALTAEAGLFSSGSSKKKNYQIAEAEIYKFQGTIHSPL